MSLEEQIKANLASPPELERIFRSNDKREFSRIIIELFNQDRTNLALSFWKERVTFDSEESSSGITADSSRLPLVIVLSIFAGLYAKLPAIFPFIDEETFYPANAPFFVCTSLIAFFVIKNKPQRNIAYALGAIFFLCVIYINLLSSFTLTLPNRLLSRWPDTLVLASMHMPLVLGSLLGVSFIANDLGNHAKRIRFLSYLGETSIYSGIILVGGVVLTALTVALFGVISVEIEKWYLPWVVVFGLVAAPIVATYISTNRFALSGKLTPLLARIFSPLFLLTLAAYLVVIAVQGKSPFTDRNFLIVFNAMLIIVLAITVFAIIERPSKTSRCISDYINFALLCVALIINGVALAAIISRLALDGLTPNRAAVLGSNAIIFIHLFLISHSYLNFIRNKASISSIHERVSSYLPVYSVWSAIVVFAFPVLFSFK